MGKTSDRQSFPAPRLEPHGYETSCAPASEPGAKFCVECSAPLERTCASCGALVSSTAKFCPECAHPIGKAAAAPEQFDAPQRYTPKHLAEKILLSKSALEGERKQVTVLFADLKSCSLTATPRTPASCLILCSSR